MSTPTSPSLTFLIARDAPFGVIARRGPARRVCLIGWDIRKGTFEIGHWYKGRVDLLDLSPDGGWLLTTCDKGYDAWTVLSKPPYLTAHGLWQAGEHGGGAHFSGRNDIVLHGVGPAHGVTNIGPYRLPTAMKVRLATPADIEQPAEPSRWHWVPGSRYKHPGHALAGEFDNGYAVDGPKGLRLQRNLRGQMRLVGKGGRPLFVLPKPVRLADFNPWGAHAGLVFALGGRLHALPETRYRDITDDAAFMAAAVELADFSSLAFETKPAPGWALPARHLAQEPRAWRPAPREPAGAETRPAWDPLAAPDARKPSRRKPV